MCLTYADNIRVRALCCLQSTCVKAGSHCWCESSSTLDQERGRPTLYHKLPHYLSATHPCRPHCVSCPSVCLSVCPYCLLTQEQKGVEKPRLVCAFPTAGVIGVPVFGSKGPKTRSPGRSEDKVTGCPHLKKTAHA